MLYFRDLNDFAENYIGFEFREEFIVVAYDEHIYVWDELHDAKIVTRASLQAYIDRWADNADIVLSVNRDGSDIYIEGREFKF